jgi:toxin-antitoxin system PIN domain toxin
VKISLPDVNILLALSAEGHTHHVFARSWFAAQTDSTVAICCVTQMGLPRLVTNPKVLASGVCSIREAWNIANEIRADRRIVFAQEPASLEQAWAELMNHPTAWYTSWTDAYLAAFARERDYTLVTFDRGFRRWADLSLELLPVAGNE